MNAFMPNIYLFPEGQIIAFVLVLLRILAFFIAWPVFGSNLVPVSVKVLLSICVALMMFPVIQFQNPASLKISEEIIFFTIRELAIGLVMGFMMRMFFFAVSIAGEIISVTIGLSAAQIFNPTLGTQSNVTEQFQQVLATLFFLALNGHHIFLSGLASSFELVPISAMGLKYQGFVGLAAAAQEALLMGLKMAAPIVVAVFLANISMGVLGRTVPQINVLVTSLSVTIIIGLGVLFFTIPLMVLEMNGILNIMADQFFKMLRVL